ncbi:MAG: phytoene desaturase family protein [Pseudomonadota bacterium]|nr:phytoene desaturase family protein [Pseudomonadota bacterium]
MNVTRQTDTDRVIVVGAGMGGLVAALELAARGFDVLVLERALQPGGKMRQIAIGGAMLDAGPTVFTMRWVFDALFDAVGLHLDDHLRLEPVELLARHAWGPDARLDLHADRARSAAAIGDFAGAAAARGYLQFCARAGAIYRTLEAPFLRGSRPTPFSLAARVGLRGLPGLMQISPFATLWSELGRHFNDERLRQLFGRYATYCGASPFLAPATLMLVAHVEQEGVWLVDGGMHRVAQVLARLACERGARLRYGTAVQRILTRHGHACGVRLEDGEELHADAVVFNGDVAALHAGLLDADTRATAPVGRAGRSLSALTWNLLAPTHGFPLARHSVFFSDNSAREFDDLFGAARLPQEPTVYVCAQDRDGKVDDPHLGECGAAERLLLIVNAPAVGDQRAFTLQELQRCETRTFQRLAQCGLQVDRSAERTVLTTPQDFERLFSATGGALYGQAPHGWAASFKRPGARSRLKGLYLAGGSVHPGPGVPMAALSGRQAAASVLADRPSARGKQSPPRPSTAQSRPVDTLGGTSTRSATTASRR